MIISLPESLNTIGAWQREYARERVLYGLARFSDRISEVSVSMQQLASNSKHLFECRLEVWVEGFQRPVTVRRKSTSMLGAVNSAVLASEPWIALRCNWRSWFNFDTLATGWTALRNR